MQSNDPLQQIHIQDIGIMAVEIAGAALAGAVLAGGARSVVAGSAGIPALLRVGAVPLLPSPAEPSPRAGPSSHGYTVVTFGRYGRARPGGSQRPKAVTIEVAFAALAIGGTPSSCSAVLNSE